MGANRKLWTQSAEETVGWLLAVLAGTALENLVSSNPFLLYEIEFILAAPVVAVTAVLAKRRRSAARELVRMVLRLLGGVTAIVAGLLFANAYRLSLSIWWLGIPVFAGDVFGVVMLAHYIRTVGEVWGLSESLEKGASNRILGRLYAKAFGFVGKLSTVRLLLPGLVIFIVVAILGPATIGGPATGPILGAIIGVVLGSALQSQSQAAERQRTMNQETVDRVVGPLYVESQQVMRSLRAMLGEATDSNLEGPFFQQPKTSWIYHSRLEETVQYDVEYLLKQISSLKVAKDMVKTAALNTITQKALQHFSLTNVESVLLFGIRADGGGESRQIWLEAALGLDLFRKQAEFEPQELRVTGSSGGTQKTERSPDGDKAQKYWTDVTSSVPKKEFDYLAKHARKHAELLVDLLEGEINRLESF